MITQMDLSLLTNYATSEGIATSFYLNTDKSKRNRAMWDIETKDLIKNARKNLEGINANHRSMEAAEKNFQQIYQLASMAGDPLGPEIPWHEGKRVVSLHHVGPPRYKSLAIFADSSNDFLQVYRLPVNVKSTIMLGRTFNVLPLLAMLKEHYRIAMVLTDSRHARCFEIYMGEILEYLDFESKRLNLKKPLLETFMKREKRLMQRKEEEVRFHLSSVAELLKTHFNLRHFDKLIIGARKQLGEHLANLLHSKLHDNLIGVFEIDIHASENEVLAKALEAEKHFEMQEENKLLRKITNEIERDGLAVKGVKEVIEAIHDHNIHALAVSDDFSSGGLTCSKCGMPHSRNGNMDAATCVVCHKPLVEVGDMTIDIVAEAEHQGAEVRHIHGTSLISSLENVAAITKFKKGELFRSKATMNVDSWFSA